MRIFRFLELTWSCIMPATVCMEYSRGITVPASGATVPDGLKRIIVKVEVAGRTFEQISAPCRIKRLILCGTDLDYLGRREEEHCSCQR